MRAWHLRFSSDGRHPMFPTERSLRQAVRALARTAPGELVLFCIVDDHVHVVLFCERDVAGFRARSLSRVLRPLAAVPLDEAYIKAVQSRSHMQWLVRYCLSQTEHHGLQVHAATWTGSCFADLVGARRLPGLELRIRDALPRFQLRSACAAAGVELGDLQPLSWERVRSLGARRVVSAAAAVLAVDESLPGKGADVLQARRLAATAGVRAGVDAVELAWALGCQRRHVARLVERAPPEPLLRALRVRLALEEAARPATSSQQVAS